MSVITDNEQCATLYSWYIFLLYHTTCLLRHMTSNIVLESFIILHFFKKALYIQTEVLKSQI